MAWMRLEGTEPLADIAAGRTGGLQVRFGEPWDASDDAEVVRMDVERDGSTLRVGESILRRERRRETGPEETTQRGWKSLLDDVPGVFDHVPKALLQECDEDEAHVAGNCVATFPEKGVRMKGDKDVHMLFQTAGKWEQECVMHTFNPSPQAAQQGKDLVEVGRLDAGFPIRLLSCSRCPRLAYCNAPGTFQTGLPDLSDSHPPLLAAIGMYDACFICPSYSGMDHRWTMERVTSGCIASRSICDFAWNQFLQRQGVVATEGGGLALIQIAPSGIQVFCSKVGPTASSESSGRRDQPYRAKGSWKCTWGSSPTSVIHSSSKQIGKVDVRQQSGYVPLFSVQSGVILGVGGLWPIWDDVFLSQVTAGGLQLSPNLGDLACLYAASSTSHLYLLDDRYPGRPVLSWERTHTNAWDDMVLPFTNHRVRESTTEYSVDVSIGLSPSKGASTTCYPFTVSLEKERNGDALGVLGSGYGVVAGGLPFQIEHSYGKSRDVHGVAILCPAETTPSSQDCEMFAFSAFDEGQYCLQEARLEASTLTLSKNTYSPLQPQAEAPSCIARKVERRAVYLPLVCGVLFRDVDSGIDDIVPHNLLDVLRSVVQQSTHPLTEQEIASRMHAEHAFELSAMQLTEVPWFPQKRLYGHKNCTCRICERMSRKRAAAANHPQNRPVLHLEDALDFFRSQTSFEQFVVEMAGQIDCLVLEESDSTAQGADAQAHLVICNDDVEELTGSWLENPDNCVGDAMRIRQRLLSKFATGER